MPRYVRCCLRLFVVEVVVVGALEMLEDVFLLSALALVDDAPIVLQDVVDLAGVGVIRGGCDVVVVGVRGDDVGEW